MTVMGSVEVTKKNFKSHLKVIKDRDIEESVFMKPQFPADLWDNFVAGIENEINAKPAEKYRLTIIKTGNRLQFDLSFELIGLYTANDIIEQADKAISEKATVEEMFKDYIRENGVVNIANITNQPKQDISSLINNRKFFSIQKIKNLAEKIKDAE